MAVEEKIVVAEEEELDVVVVMMENEVLVDLPKFKRRACSTHVSFKKKVNGVKVKVVNVQVFVI